MTEEERAKTIANDLETLNGMFDMYERTQRLIETTGRGRVAKAATWVQNELADRIEHIHLRMLRTQKFGSPDVEFPDPLETTYVMKQAS